MGRPRGNNRMRNVGAPQAHALFPSDIESRRAKARLTLQSFTSRPLDDRPIIAPATDGHRRRAMENWISYFTDVMQIDPNQIWLGLCHGTEDAINYCRLYLNSYVEDSVQKFVVLRPEEYESRRTVNSASTVIQCWRELIAQADSTVLLDKRREDAVNF
ncbi:hypothetical protein EJ04DRAFT_558741 [Polyplosphaeria fusca]|uniref:Uncharacterized protein n=1 Tax=Polyplosphaeria fusca TaxID=682080 RepID=A0A9P4RCV2_9PLEO|nr:hypothetical protein EJ04DRAFT_558741 [Polyplosphaeria fusca]